MSSFLNDIRITSARLNIPAWGVPYAEVKLDGEHELSGAVTLKLEDLTIVGTVISGGSDHGRSQYRIAGGKAGWGKTIPAKSYADDLGVKLSKILNDAATAAGETIDQSTISASRIGPAWVRENAPAGRVLEALAPANWYIDESGTTKMGRRPATQWSGKAAFQPIDRARGSVMFAPESLATLLPGAIVENIEAVDVLHEVSAEGVRTTIWGTDRSETSRMLSVQRETIAALFPTLRFGGVFEYRIVQQTGERLDLQAVRVSAKMPDLLRVPVRPGVPGCRADHKLGSRVLVAFIDSDPSRPVVVGFEDADGSGFRPDALTLQAGSTGSAPTEHAISAEAVVNLLLCTFQQIAVSIPGLMTGATLYAQAPTFMPLAIAATIGADPSFAAVAPSIATALAAKTPNVTGLLPNIGWPSVEGG